MNIPVSTVVHKLRNSPVNDLSGKSVIFLSLKNTRSINRIYLNGAMDNKNNNNYNNSNINLALKLSWDMIFSEKREQFSESVARSFT